VPIPSSLALLGACQLFAEVVFGSVIEQVVLKVLLHDVSGINGVLLGPPPLLVPSDLHSHLLFYLLMVLASLDVVSFLVVLFDTSIDLLLTKGIEVAQLQVMGLGLNINVVVGDLVLL